MKKTDKEWAKQALSLMDLTSLNDNDGDADIVQLCQHAQTAFGSPAALCVYPRFVPLAQQQLARQGLSKVKVATVTNFPHGNDNLMIAMAETRAAVAYGADEVDVVFPYRSLLNGDIKSGAALVEQCKAICADKTLKVIIESGELKTAENIRMASEISIKAGADFIKTSTGKVAVNATLEAAEVMLQTIVDLGVQQRVGFKAAGGVRTTQEAIAYLQLAEKIMGADWINARHFRFGASGLLNNLLATLRDEKSGVAQGSY